jgi:tetratricopeptide (TPR) repeat protein
VRRLPRFRELIARLEVPATFSFTVENGAVTVPLPEPPVASPVLACEWQLRLGDLHFDLDRPRTERAVAAFRRALAAPAGCLAPAREASAAAWVGSLDLGAGRHAESLPLLDRALALTPDDPAILTNRALALDALGRRSEATATWARIAALAAGTPLGERAQVRARNSASR